MAHAIRYFCSWETEVYKHQMRLELWEKDYEGEATAMVLSGEPQLTMEEGDTICGSSLDFGLLSETNGQYLHLYTTDNHKYLIKILRDSAVMWEGYLLPEYYSEAYIAAPYTVNFTATDWLGMLKNIDFPAEDTRVPILQIIKTCLQYTELPLDFACQLNLRVEGINDTTNILGALYLNPITFTGYNCYEVLEKILAAFNATLRQSGHRWLISSIDDDVPLRLISWDNLTYTGDGESNNGELIGTNFAGTFIDGSMTMAISPAKKSVDLSQDIFYRESWLKDYDFHSADAWTWPANTSVVKPGLAYYIKDGVLLEQISVEYLIARRRDSHKLSYISQVINVEGAPDDSEYTLGIKFFTPNLVNGDNRTALWVKIINRSSTSLTQDVAYLSKDGWTNEDSYIELNGTSAEPKYISSHTYNRGGRQYLIYDKENWPTTKINFISIPYTGTLEIRIEPWYITCFGGVYLTKTNITKNLTISSSLNPDAAETASSVNLMLCDSPEERNVELGVLNYFSLSDGALTTGKKWYYNGQEYEDFLHAMAYSYSRCYANKRQKLSGTLYTDKIYNLCSFTDKWSGKRHTIKSWIYSIISERLDSMEIIETPAKEIELTLSTPEAGSSNKQNQPSGGTSGGGATSMAGSGRYVNLDTAQEVSGEKTWNDKATFKKDIVVAGDGIFGGEVSGIVGEGTPAGVTDYSALTGKPSINGKELASGDNSLDALGIQPKGDYTTASQLATTLADYATKVFVSNNYASKSIVNAIQALIPATATADNQLADKAFVNSSIATATAEFKGSFTSLDELKATSGNLNDYAFYLHTDDVGNSIVDRYKWTTAGWLYEYTLNNSSFTAEQWAALNSTITATLVQSYNSHLNNSTIHITTEERSAWNAKWDYNEETIKGVKVNAAVSADKLTTNAGTSAIPIYFKNGKPAQCIPSDLFSGFDNGYSSTGERFLGITIAGFTQRVVVAYSTLSEKANKLATARTLWGRNFDGSANVSGDLEDVGNITASGKATIQGDIISGGEVVAVAGEGTPAGVTDYSALTGKPAINGVTLVSGNNTLASLGIQAAGDYATNSGVTALLANYADKTFVSNNYVGKTAFNNHTADTDIHITAAERVAWNAKWDYNEATIKAVKVNAASSADTVAWTGISGKPSTFTPSAHTHTFASLTSKPTTIAGYGITDAIKFSVDPNYVAARFSTQDLADKAAKTYIEWWQTGAGFFNFKAGKYIVAGGTSSHFLKGDGSLDSNTYLNTTNYNSYAPSLTGTGATGTWGINITGNAASATKLQTARKIWGRPFDGNADVSGDLINVGNITASGKATIQGDIISGGEVAAIVGEGTPAGVTDYSALTGKPAINGITLVSGNNTLAALGIQAAGDYATNSGVATLLADYATKVFVSNNYADKAAFNSHIADTDIHITATERNAWNAKWDYNEDTIKAVKVTSASSADSVAWSGVKDKPTTFTPASHTHTASEISGLPTALKNPYALTFGSKTYDGSAAATITASDLGALTSITKSMVEGVLTGNITSHTHSYLPLSGGTITGDILSSNMNVGIRWNVDYVGGWARNFLEFNAHKDNDATKALESVFKIGGCGDSTGYIFTYIGANSYDSAYNIRFYSNNTITIGTYEILHANNYNSYTPTLTGTGASGTWGINISGNAATATKLQTPRTIWGQPFDGNGDVWGAIIIKASAGLYHYDSNGNNLAYIGHDYVNPYAHIYNYRSNSSIRVNDDGNICIPSGNVLIGTTTDNVGKLQVNGGVRLSANSDNGARLLINQEKTTASYNAIEFATNNTSWGYIHAFDNQFGGYLHADKNINIYSKIVTLGIWTNPALTVKSSTGNVLIGTTTDNGYKLQVNGSERVYGDLIVDGEISALVA